jgi:hypothetical protein
MSVCRHWRTMLIREHSVWSHICVTIDRNWVWDDRPILGRALGRNWDTLRWILDRSGQLPLTLTLAIGGRGRVDNADASLRCSLFSHLIASCGHRLYHLDILVRSNIDSPTLEQSLQGVFSTRLPVIRSLYIQWNNYRYTPIFCDLFQSLSSRSPRSIDLDVDQIRAGMYTIQRVTSLRSHSRFSVLDIWEWNNIEQTIESIECSGTIKALRAYRPLIMARLHTLSGSLISISALSSISFPVLQVLIIDDIYTNDVPTARSIHFPQLRSLTVKTAKRQIQALHAPLLEKLNLIFHQRDPHNMIVASDAAFSEHGARLWAKDTTIAFAHKPYACDERLFRFMERVETLRIRAPYLSDTIFPDFVSRVAGTKLSKTIQNCIIITEPVECSFLECGRR